jgi:hypothetical protein
MIGNSLKSDVLPVLELGSYGIHVPFHTTWEHERVDVTITDPKFFHAEKIHRITQFIFIMLQEINTDTWHRKEIFDFFCGFDEPYFGITADVHVSKAYQCAKEKDISFFVYYLHCTLIAINQIDALKLRILETKPVIFDTIHASATINRL